MLVNKDEYRLSEIARELKIRGEGAEDTLLCLLKDGVLSSHVLVGFERPIVVPLNKRVWRDFYIETFRLFENDVNLSPNDYYLGLAEVEYYYKFALMNLFQAEWEAYRDGEITDFYPKTMPDLAIVYHGPMNPKNTEEAQQLRQSWPLLFELVMKDARETQRKFPVYVSRCSLDKVFLNKVKSAPHSSDDSGQQPDSDNLLTEDEPESAETLTPERATKQGTQTTSAEKAEILCRAWLKNLPELPKLAKEKRFAQAKELYKALSEAAFKRAWAAYAPKSWKTPGRKS